MKISEIFRKTADAPIDLMDLGVSTGNCSCHERITGDDRDNLIKDVRSLQGEKNEKGEPTAATTKARSSVVHKAIVHSIMNDVKSGDNSNVDKFIAESGIAGAPETTEARKIGYLTHLFRHVNSAGLKPADVGVSDRQFKAFQIAKQGFEKSVGDASGDNLGVSPQELDRMVRSDHKPKECATCEKYRSDFNQGVVNYKEKAKKKLLEEAPDTAEDVADKHVEDIAKGTFEDWKHGRPSAIKDERRLHGILGRWDEHQSDAHGTTFATLDPSSVPISTSKGLGQGQRNPSVEKTFDKLLDLGKSWELSKEEGHPSDPFYDDEGKPKFTPTSTDQDRVEMEMDDHIHDLASLYPKQHIERSEGLRPMTRVDLPHGEYTGYEERTTNEPTYYTLERHLTDRTQKYVPDKTRPKIVKPNDLSGKPIEIKDQSLNAGIEGKLPRSHRWLFQETGVKPDLGEYKQHKKDLQSFENQPTHTIQDGKAIEIPADERVTKPMLDTDMAQALYQKSFDQALSLKYPDMPREQAEEQLRSDHRNAFETSARDIIESPRNLRFLSKKNEGDAMTFNSKKQSKLISAKEAIKAIAADKAKICEKCGKNCADEVECRSNVTQRRRDQAAESAYND
jgi:hypothetical protein